MIEPTIAMTYWHWWTIAVSLLVLEVLIPGTFFLWPAMAAIGMGLLILLVPTLIVEYQIFIFALASIVSVFVSRYYLTKNPELTDQPFLNQRGAECIGRIFTLTEPIVNGRGRTDIDDTSWSVEGPDVPCGTNVKVIGVNGIRLQVEPVAVEPTKSQSQEEFNYYE